MFSDIALKVNKLTVGNGISESNSIDYTWEIIAYDY